MILWIILAVMTVIAVLVILIPLLRQGEGVDTTDASDVDVYKDQLKEVKQDFDRGVIAESEAEGARAEIARRLLKAADSVSDNTGSSVGSGGWVTKATSVFAIALIPAFSLGIYLLKGTPDLPGQPFAERQNLPSSTTVAQEDTAQLLITRAEEHLAKNPDDIRGWQILAPIYTRLRRFSDATFALKKVMVLSGNKPDATADYGESLIMGNRGEVSAQALVVFKELLKTNPNMPRPLHYIALADAQAGRLKEAAAKWRSLLASNPQDAPWRADIERLAARAEGKEPPKVVASAPPPVNAAPTGTPPGNQLPTLSNEQMNAANSMDVNSRQQMIASMVKRLSDRLSENGGPVGEWIKLARTQIVLGKTDAAKTALASAEAAYASDTAAMEQIKNARVQLGLGTATTQSSSTQPAQTNQPSSSTTKTASLPQGSQLPQLSKEQMNAAGSMDAGSRQQMIVGMVKRLSDRLAENGGSVGEWIKLARTQKVLGKTDEARAALASAEVAYADKPEALDQLKNARLQLGIEP